MNTTHTHWRTQTHWSARRLNKDTKYAQAKLLCRASPPGQLKDLLVIGPRLTVAAVVHGRREDGPVWVACQHAVHARLPASAREGSRQHRRACRQRLSPSQCG